MPDSPAEVRLRSALEHHRNGRLDEAARDYEAALRAQPGDADAMRYLGVILHQRGEHANAVHLIERSVEVRPDAQAFCNLAEALRACGRPAEAGAAARRALELRPRYPEAQVNLAAALFAQDQFAQAESAARAALALRPGYALASLALADALREQDRLDEAERAYRAVLVATPAHPIALGNLGWMLVQAGRMKEGLELCRSAAAQSPGALGPQENLARALLVNGRTDEAMGALEAALKLAPDAAVLNLLAGIAWHGLGDVREARKWFERARQIDPALVEAQVRLANLESESDNQEAALEILNAALARHPLHTEVLVARAKARLAVGDVEGAIADHRAAIELRPGAAALHATLGGTLASAGDIDAAVACERKAIALNARCVPAYAGLLTALRHKAKEPERDAALQLLDAPWMTDEWRSALHMGLAAYFDGRADYAAAGEHMVRGNALRLALDTRRGKSYDPGQYETLASEMIATFTPELFERLRPYGEQSARPVFIVGMPRSGTTLTEQILASHPSAFGAGERRFAHRGFGLLPRLMGRGQQDPFACLREAEGSVIEAAARWHLDQLAALDGGRAARIVDKMPDNYSLLGWLAVLFPKARFIHCRRDLRDIALSCWITNFSSIRWANDLGHLAHRIEQYSRLMAHWRRVLPVRVLELDYEAMVADQVGQSRRLVEFLGLEWDERCLSFFKTQRVVRTASIAQVREPIYNRSIARWVHYEAMLEPVISRLGAGMGL
ncbi:MAG TPA: sulfotransferase [Usitatibacter sp.]|nr:sulfotransferase [Usitatibacter sp.]